MKSEYNYILEIELNAIVEKQIPGWKEIVRSGEFKKWAETQESEVRDLANSDYTDDAILMISLYLKHREVIEEREKSDLYAWGMNKIKRLLN